MPDPTTQMSLADAEAAARGGLTKISKGKRAMIRFLEILTYPLVRTVELLRGPRLRGPDEPRNILVLEFWNIGDIVMLLPFLKELRTYYPNARITLVTSPKVAPLLEAESLVDKVILVRVPWAQYFSLWKKHNPFSSLWIDFLRCLRTRRRDGFDL